MKKILLLFFLYTASSCSQIQNELHSPQNIKKFADYLFNEKDYLRSAIEYEKLIDFKKNDTLEFKIALSFQQMGKYNNALEKFINLKSNSVFYEKSKREYFKTFLLAEKYTDLQSRLSIKNTNDFQRLLYLSYLFSGTDLPNQQNFLKIFSSNEKENILNFYNHKKNPPHKSQLLSGILSAIIPGSGKIYLDKIGDGIVAFLATSVFTFLAYDNFANDHNFRGWLFSGLGFFFYAGNIYGSVVAAQIYNAEIDYQYNSNLKEYLKSKNYFLPENEFIK